MNIHLYGVFNHSGPGRNFGNLSYSVSRVHPQHLCSTATATGHTGRCKFAGTWIPVSVILDCLASGMTAEAVTREYPTVSLARVLAASAYGAVLAREELLPIPQTW